MSRAKLQKGRMGRHKEESTDAAPVLGPSTENAS